MTELQKKIADQDRYLKEIEKMHSELQFLQIQMKEFEDCIEFLDEKRESLDPERKDAEERNEDYEKQKKAKDEADYKRLIAKITRDKNQDVKDIIHNEEM